LFSGFKPATRHLFVALRPVMLRKRYRPRDRSVETLFKHPLGGGF
jgi:hypothetical protein